MSGWGTGARGPLGAVSAPAPEDQAEQRDVVQPDPRQPDAAGPSPAASAEALRAWLDGDQAETWRRVRDFLSRPALVPPVGATTSAHRTWVTARLHDVAAEGQAALGFPPEVGGQDDTAAYLTGFQCLAMGDLSLLVKTGVQFGLCAGAVLHLGTERHHAALLPDLLAARTYGCFAMTETGHGSDVQHIRTTVTHDAGTDELVVHTPDVSARKDYIGNAARDGRLAVVFAQLRTATGEHGVHAVVVPLRDDDGRALPGVAVEDDGAKLGLHGVDNGRIAFDSVRVPRSALLDRFGTVAADGTYTSPVENPSRRFFTMLGTLVQGRVSIAGAATSAAAVGLTLAVRYAQVRTQFRRPVPAGAGPEEGDGEPVTLLDYTTHQRRLLPLVAQTYAFSSAQRHLVAELVALQGRERAGTASEGERRALESRAAGLKAVATWGTTSALQVCREACGGAGYLAANRIAALRTDTDVFTTFEGDNTVLLQLVAKGLLTEMRSVFEDADARQTARLVVEQLVDAVVERSAARALVQRLVDAVPGLESDREPDVLDRRVQLQLFAWREEHLLSTVAGRLRAGRAAGGDPFEVVNSCGDHVVELGRAAVERQVLQAAAADVDACPDPAARALLGRVLDLWAVAVLERERAYLTEHGRLSQPRGKRLVGLVGDLCSELRPSASVLVDAFGVPEAQLDVPMLELAGPGAV